jgi:HAMP domain-containing protein
VSAASEHGLVRRVDPGPVCHVRRRSVAGGDSLGPTRKTEKARLTAEYDRAARVLAEIDAVTGKSMRLSAEQRHQNENRIRAAIDRLLRGQIPPGGKCDVMTLAQAAGIDRTAFYGSRPYARLREEFETRMEAMRAADDLPEPRDARVNRLKTEVAVLRQRLTRRWAVRR